MAQEYTGRQWLKNDGVNFDSIARALHVQAEPARLLLIANIASREKSVMGRGHPNQAFDSIAGFTQGVSRPMPRNSGPGSSGQTTPFGRVHQASQKQAAAFITALKGLTRTTAILALLAVTSLGKSGQAWAQCNIPSFSPGDDNASCRGTLTGFDTLAGDDAVTIGTFFDDTSGSGTYSFGEGEDYLQIYEIGGHQLSGTNVTIDMGSDNDRAIYYTYDTPVAWSGSTFLGAGNDNFGITDDFSHTGDVSGGEGNDTIQIGRNSFGNLGVSGGADTPLVVGDIDGEDGDDSISVTDGATVQGGLFGGAGTDSILIDTSGAVIRVEGGDEISPAGDSIRWTEGTITDGIYGGNGSDTVTVTAADYDGAQVLDGGGDSATGSIDDLRLDGVTATANGVDLPAWELVNLTATALTIADGAWTMGALTVDPASFLSTQGNGAANDTITVLEDYNGAGQLIVDTDYSTDSADTLVVGGDVIAGVSTTLVVDDVSAGAATGNDILVVEVTGASPADAFTLQGGFIEAGDFRYTLERNDADGNWYLVGARVAGLMSPAAPVPTLNHPGLAVLAALMALMGMLWMRQRQIH